MRPFYLVSFIPISDLSVSSHKSPVVRAAINGRGYWFLVDTGSSDSLLKYSVFKEAKLKFVDVTPLTEESNLAQLLLIDGKYRGTHATKFHIGNVRFPYVPFYVAPDDVLSIVIGKDPSFAGILGAEFVEKFAMYINFENREIRLLAHGKVNREELALLGFDPRTTTVAPLKENNDIDRKFMVNALLNRKPVSLCIDTGGVSSAVHLPLSRFGIKPENTKRTTIRRFEGVISARTAPAKLSIREAGVTLPVDFRDGEAMVGNGELSIDFLTHFYVLLDLPGGKIYLRPRNTK